MEALLREMLQLPDPDLEPDEAEEEAPALSLEEQVALEREDRWAAQLGCVPFREQFPLWERSPASLSEWLATAQAEFVTLGICQVAQRRDMATIESVWRETPAQAQEVLHGFAGLHHRFSKMSNALHGEAIRYALARQRVLKAGEVDGAALTGIAMLSPRAVLEEG